MVERNLTSQLVAQIQPLTGKGARGIAAKKKLGIACPVCGAELVTTPFGYGCSNYKKTALAVASPSERLQGVIFRRRSSGI